MRCYYLKNVNKFITLDHISFFKKNCTGRWIWIGLNELWFFAIHKLSCPVLFFLIWPWALCKTKMACSHCREYHSEELICAGSWDPIAEARKPCRARRRVFKKMNLKCVNWCFKEGHKACRLSMNSAVSEQWICDSCAIEMGIPQLIYCDIGEHALC